MNNEIKEILDRLERIDHKEYSCGFEFADSSSFDEDCRCFEERKKMANYITNLQQENKQLRKDYAKIIQDNCYTLKLEKRIDKAIEYIESYKTDYSPYELSDYNIRKILDILKGDSN